MIAIRESIELSWDRVIVFFALRSCLICLDPDNDITIFESIFPTMEEWLYIDYDPFTQYFYCWQFWRWNAGKIMSSCPWSCHLPEGISRSHSVIWIHNSAIHIIIWVLYFGDHPALILLHIFNFLHSGNCEQVSSQAKKKLSTGHFVVLTQVHIALLV